MSDPVLSPNVAGSVDGAVPIYNPRDRWTTWLLKEIFDGKIGVNRFVPKVDDLVVDVTSIGLQYYRVIQVDLTTGLSTLVPVKSKEDALVDESNYLLNVGPGTVSDTFRVYINKRVFPFTMTVDQRCYIPGSMATKCRLFRGSLLAANPEVVSGYYDNLGKLTTTDIRLELASINNVTNVATKTIPTCYTTHDLIDNEFVVAVFYSDDGSVVSKAPLIVENTAYVPAPSIGSKYVASISLESPFLSATIPDTILYPINVPLSGLNLIGVVEYSDGSKLRLPVDGTRFEIFGFEDFVASIPNEEFPIRLKYNLAPGEAVYGSQHTGNGMFITHSYKAKTLMESGAYTNKLFAYPVWVSPSVGYRLEWFLYSLERTKATRVTQYVRTNLNAAAFDPIAYGVKQSLGVSIRLNEVNGSYPDFIHTQVVDVTLLGRGDTELPKWNVGFTPNQAPAFGGMFAKLAMVDQSNWRLRLDSNRAKYSDWINDIYALSKPMIDPAKESQIIDPSHFIVVVGMKEFEFPVAQWNSTLSIPAEMPAWTTIFLKFIKKIANNDLQLAIAALPVHQGANEFAPLVQTPPLTVDVGNGAFSASSSTEGAVSVGLLATPSGGVGPYRMTWTRVTGSRFTFNDYNTSNPTATANMVNGEDVTEQWQVKVMDSTDNFVLAMVGVRLKVAIPLQAGGAQTPLVISSPNVGVVSGNLIANVVGGVPPYSYSWTINE